ncbi:LysM peptidoglycan-binding domain-containing protein [Acetobacter sicerae]|uniref:LysM peptidoglycan-binding domain-containing protein n=1 Tax=Acetobacter sicerae TaxID=85325 RepID=UPI00156B61C8|nr:LysM peptidoglycan-binding domain-containing protein [Acetobacter sicerae]NHN93659.1 LysM peptidoglycan-binding domain-containing protein [Acetobacter sicerae]
MKPGKTINVSASDISLWHIAAKYLGDATQANRIMSLNNLNDTWILTVTTLTLPSYDLSQGGGISQ